MSGLRPDVLLVGVCELRSHRSPEHEPQNAGMPKHLSKPATNLPKGRIGRHWRLHDTDESPSIAVGAKIYEMHTFTLNTLPRT